MEHAPLEWRRSDFVAEETPNVREGGSGCRVLAVTGTDTEIGKTVITMALATVTSWWVQRSLSPPGRGLG